MSDRSPLTTSLDAKETHISPRTDPSRPRLSRVPSWQMRPELPSPPKGPLQHRVVLTLYSFSIQCTSIPPLLSFSQYPSFPTSLLVLYNFGTSIYSEMIPNPHYPPLVWLRSLPSGPTFPRYLMNSFKFKLVSSIFPEHQQIKFIHRTNTHYLQW